MSCMISRIASVCFVLALHSFAQFQISGLDVQKRHIKDPVTVSIERDTAIKGDSLSLILTLNMEKNVHVYAAESLFFNLSITAMRGLESGTVKYPQHHAFVNFDKSSVNVYLDRQAFVITYPVVAPQWSISGTLQMQACDSQMCFTPRRFVFSAGSDGTVMVRADTSGIIVKLPVSESEDADIMQRLLAFTVKGQRGGFLNVEKFGAFLKDPSGSESGGKALFDQKGLLVIILLILLGGIALNLTPCVLPMIPITIAVLGAGAQAGSRGRGMFVGAVYGCAMALTYGILGLVVVLTGTRFGVINSSPVFNIVIAAVFVIMALAMFDIIRIDFTGFRKAGGTGKERGRLATVFIMGVLASILAGACVAPVVIAVVLYAGTLYAAGNIAGLLLPFLLGIGMALPWPFAGAGLSLLPKPGKWMVWVKYVFGIFILVMALYYGAEGVKILHSRASLQKQQTSAGASFHKTQLDWFTDLREGLSAAQMQKKPVLIDFWASWCKNCTVMDATTLRHPEIENLLKDYVLIKYQAEQPDEQETKKILDYFKIVGLPAYVIMEPR